MLTKFQIEKTLNTYYTAVIRKKGSAYFLEDMVIGASINEDQETVIGEVYGSGRNIYKVVFELFEDGSMNGSCNCPYNNHCKHEAALLYELLDWVKSQEPKPALKRKRVPKKVLEPKKKPVKKSTSDHFQLQGESAGTYRKFPVDAPNFYVSLQQYRPKSYRSLQWNESFEGTFISPTEIEIQNKEAYNSYYGGFEEKKISIKIEGGDFFVKCLSCNST